MNKPTPWDWKEIIKLCAYDDVSRALIVRAVNVHEELLAIVRDERGRYPDGSGRALELDALIAKAEGRP